MLEKEIKFQEANSVDAALEKHVPIVKIEEQCPICKAPQEMFKPRHLIAK
jgi:desulfoferrodoxin (superoxide reductase-like protein)